MDFPNSCVPLRSDFLHSVSMMPAGRRRRSVHRAPGAAVRIALGIAVLAATWMAAPMADAQADGDLRLRHGGDEREGNIQVFHNGKWGLVCDDWFDRKDAKVACRQLGYDGVEFYTLRNYFYDRRQDVTIWLDDLECRGNETRLGDCPRRNGLDWGQHNCTAPEEAAGVRCSG